MQISRGLTERSSDTDFIVSAGPDSYAWNVVRSESDNLMFQHAGRSGAKIFDGTKVSAIEFAPLKPQENPSSDPNVPSPGRPVSATWSRKDGSSGEITFDYLVDASGRAGVVSTKYLKNRTFNQDLKNVASWGYWKGAIQYGEGTPKEGQPFFEALQGIHSAPARDFSQKAILMRFRTPQTGADGHGSSLCTTGPPPSASS